MLSRWINVGLGVWLVVAAILAGRGVEMLNNLLLGVGLFLFGFLAMGVLAFGRLCAVLGLWAVASPFVLGYHGEAAGLNDLAVGALVITTSLWQRRSAPTSASRMA